MKFEFLKFEKLFNRLSNNLLSFSIPKKKFGFFSKISCVKLPNPGPISNMVSLFILVKLTIFFITFLSVKKF